jgi:hypothetical protein
MSNYTLRPWLVVIVLNVLYLGVIFAVNEADPKEFVTLGECFRQCVGNDGEDCADGTEGYDGQFAYYIARNLTGSPDCLDVPAYRLQRILLPALARALSLGQTALVPWALVLINLAALGAGTALLEDLLAAAGVSRWFALSYGLFVGVFMAVRLSTNEALAYGLVIAGIWFEQHERPWATAAMLALAALAKETTGLFVGGYLLAFALQRRWWDALRMVLVVGGPFVAWQGVLYDWVDEFGVGSGGAKGTPFEIIPYAGVLKIATEGSFLAFLVLGVLLVIPAAVVPSLWGMWQTGRDLRAGKHTTFACLLLANAAIMPFVPFSTYREFLGLLRFMPGLVLSVVLYAAHARHRRALLYSTLWIVLLLFVVSG